jgi:hypothetical protein
MFNACERNVEHPDVDMRSQILLPDGKWVIIDMSYDALFVLLAAHVKIDRSAMPRPEPMSFDHVPVTP